MLGRGHDSSQRSPGRHAIVGRVNLLKRRVGALLRKNYVVGTWAVAGLVNLAVILIVASHAWQDYRSGIVEAQQKARFVSSLKAEHLGRSLGEVLLLLETIGQELEFIRGMPSPTSKENIQSILEEKFFRLAQLEALAVFDAAGQPSYLAGEWPGVLGALGTLPGLSQMRQATGINITISSPFRIAKDGLWRLGVGLRMGDPDGRFAGAVVAILDPRFFLESQTQDDLVKTVDLNFFQAGNIVLAHGPHADQPAPVPQFEGQLFPDIAFDGQVGTFESKRMGSPGLWIVSFNRLPLGNLIVGAAIAKKGLLSAWLARSVLGFAIAVGTVVLLSLFSWFGTRQMAQRVRAERTARRAENRLYDGIESMKEGFALFDRDDRLVLCNSMYRTIYGNVAEVIVPGEAREGILRAAAERGIFPDAHKAGIEEWVKNTFELGKDAHNVSEHLTGSGRWIEISEKQTHDGGRIGVHKDITEQKQREAALTAAKESAEQASRSKSEFLAMVSHELRTPLNAIIGFSEIMKTETFGPVGVGENDHYTGYVQDINASGMHLLQVINDILDLSKAEAGKIELKDEDLSIDSVIESCLRLVSQNAIETGIAIERPAAGRSGKLRADPRALKQMLLNLVSNAIKFTPKGGKVTIRVTARDDADLYISVSDTGIGIAKEDIPKVLSPFEQVDSRLAREFEGTGLGLPLVKHLIEAHGGRLTVESEVGNGTTVILRFPADRVLSDFKAA